MKNNKDIEVKKKKKRKPFLLRLFIFLFWVVIVIGVIGAGGYFFVKLKFDVDIIEAYTQLKVLNQEVDTNTKYDNQFTDTDMQSFMTKVNNSVPGLISYDETEGYKVDPPLVTLMLHDISLTDKETGALLETLMNTKDIKTFDLGSMSLPFSLIQIEFSNINDGTVDFNTVVAIDTTQLKDQLSSFPMSLLKSYVPTSIYLSSTITLAKEETAFTYTVNNKTLEANNVTDKNTTYIFSLINKFIEAGTAEDISKTIGQTVADALIGNSSTEGFAYGLHAIGSTDYNFAVESETNYFKIVK